MRKREGGYIMAGALAALLAMSVVAAALVGSTVEEARRVRAAEVAAQRDALLDGAIALAVAEIAQEPRRRDVGFEGGRATVRVGGEDVRLAVRFESDKLDVNAAEPEAVAAALRAAGVPEAEARIVAGALARRDGEPAPLLDDLLTGVPSAECVRQMLTVFGGRAELVPADEADDERPRPFPRPAPGARVAVTAFVGAGAGARGREAVILFTGGGNGPGQVMEARRAADETPCHGGENEG